MKDKLQKADAWLNNNIGKIGSVANGVAGILDTSLRASQIADTSRWEDQIAGMSDWRGQNFYDNSSYLSSLSAIPAGPFSVSGKDLGPSNAQVAGYTATGALQGAMAGASLGVVGAGVGAVVGGLAGLIGGRQGQIKGDITADYLNSTYDFQERQNEIAREIGADQAHNSMYNSLYATRLAKGGGIHIKKSNEGKFTAAAKRHNMTVQEFAKHVLAKKNADKYSATMRKRANFARNAAGWKHADGGRLFVGGGKTDSSRRKALDFLWAMENEGRVGRNSDGSYSPYSDPAGKGLQDVGPGLLVGSSIAKKDKYSLNEIEDAAYKYYTDSLSRIGAAYDAKYGKGEFEKVPEEYKQLAVDLRYRTGSLSPDKWPKFYQAMRDQDAIAALTHSRTRFGKNGYDNGRVQRLASRLFPGIVVEHNGNKDSYLKIYRPEQNAGQPVVNNDYSIDYVSPYWSNEEQSAPAENYSAEVRKIMNSKAPFIQRLNNNDRRYVVNPDLSLSSHRLGWVTDDRGAVIFPEVQEIDGELVDTGRAPYDPYLSALAGGDTVRTSAPVADYFTREYKNLYPGYFAPFSGDQFAEGGKLNTGIMSDYNTHGGYYAPEELVHIGAGGTHEENPNGGIQYGVDDQGIPNLVEEGEDVYKDYVFSDRLKPSKSELKMFNLPEKYSEKTFAEISELLSDEAKDRPNDAVSANGMGAMLDRLMACQEEHKQKLENNKAMRNAEDQYAELASIVDQMSPEQINELAMQLQGGAPQQMPQDVMQVPVQGMPQEAMVPAPEQMPMASGGPLKRKYWGGGGVPVTFKDVLDAQKFKFKTPSLLQPTQPTANTFNYDSNGNLVGMTPMKPISLFPQIKTYPGFIGVNTTVSSPAGNTKTTYNPPVNEDKPLNTALRYTGIGQNTAALLQNILQKPDEVHWNRLKPRYVAGNLALQKMNYTPLDYQLMANQINANNAATTRAIGNAGLGPAAGAMLLAAGYNGNQSLGNAYWQTQQANDQRKAQILGQNNQAEHMMQNFALQRDMRNAMLGTQVDQLNSQLAMDETLRNIGFENDKYNAISQTSDALAQGLAGIGRENFIINQIKSNSALFYGVGRNGWAYYKGWDGIDWKRNPQTGETQAVMDRSEIPQAAGTRACGGHVMLKKYKG